MNIVAHANPGTNEARYVGMGIHESSSGLNVQRYQEYGDEGLAFCVEHGITNWTGYRRIYFIMPAALAQRNKQAEAQHLADHQIAHDRTFGLLEKTLASLKSRGKVRGNFVPLPNHVVTMFEQAMRRLKVKPQLLQYAKMGLHMNAWKAKYEELAKKSGQRDAKGWHTLAFKYFDSEKSNRWDGLPIHYMGTTKAQGGEPPAYMEMVTSPTFRLNPTFDQIG